MKLKMFTTGKMFGSLKAAVDPICGLQSREGMDWGMKERWRTQYFSGW